MMINTSRRQRLHAVVVLAAAFTLVASSVDARAGRGGGGFGSRGARTFEAPPATATAPRPAAPIERSATPQPARPAANAAAQRPAMAGPQGGFMGMRGGFMGGLLGAGLFGMLLGYGFAGGLGGLGSILGILLQVALIVILARLAFRAFQAFQRRSQPAYAGAGAASAPQPGYGVGGPRASANRPAIRDEIGISQADLSEFERLLVTLQTAYGQEDSAGLRAVTTPEVAAQLESELAENSARGVVNRVRDVRLEQGDLAEAWREGSNEYATVAMRFSHVDHTDDRATGRTVEGDPNGRTEATEVWTFTRPRGGPWRLAAIQPV